MLLQLYNNGMTSSKAKRILSYASKDVLTYSGISQFDATEVLVVTWENMMPYVTYANLVPWAKNTYQLVLMSDATRQRAFVQFLYGSLGWDQGSRWPNQVGFYSQSQANTYTYNSPFAGTTQAFALDKIKGNSGEYMDY